MPNVPAVTADQMREIERIIVGDLRIEPVQIAENVGRDLAQLAWDKWGPRRVVVAAGPGSNGAGGLVAARHLASRGIEVAVLLSRDPDELGPVAAHGFDVAQRMGLAWVSEIGEADLLVDALVGYGLRGAPVGRAAELIRQLNSDQAPVLSLDTPSGLDVTTGVALDPCVRADATMALALPKVGLLDAAETGDLYLADISIPPSVFERIGLEVPADLFATGAVIPLEQPGS